MFARFKVLLFNVTILDFEWYIAADGAREETRTEPKYENIVIKFSTPRH